jgi:uncharacterized cupredoxin-like copper-binding protein
MKIHNIAVPVALALMACGAWAHNDKHHPAQTDAPVVLEQKDWGIAGNPKAAVRTIEFRMGDAMRFTPATLQVRRGETLRLRVRNDGRLMHEYVIGTPAENAKHAELMVKFPNMEHDEPYMAHVPPGQTRDIVWTFNRAGTFEFACLIAGHYGAGMKGSITVEN